MSLTSAEVDICNQALGKIGGKQITVAVQTSTEGVQCNLHYAQTRDALLRSFWWNFASDSLTLSDDWATDTDYTTDQYAWEDDELYKCNEAHKSDEFVSNYLYWEDELLYYEDDPLRDSYMEFNWDLYLTRPPFHYDYKYALPSDFLRLKETYYPDNNWTIEGVYFLADDTEVEIEYIKKVTETTEWDSLFTECLILQLAIKLLHPLAGTGVTSLKQGILQELGMAMTRARTICSNEINHTGRSDWNLSRF